MKWRAAVRALDDWMLTDIGLGRREIESAIYDSDPGNALLWHASASTDARHFSIAPDPDLINDRSGSDASKAIGRIVGACQDCAKTGRKFDALVRVVKCQEPTTTCLFDHLVGVGEQGRGHGEQFFTTSSSLAPRSHRRRYSIPTDPPRATLQHSIGLLDRGDEDFRTRLEIALVPRHVNNNGRTGGDKDFLFSLLVFQRQRLPINPVTTCSTFALVIVLWGRRSHG